MDRRGFLGLARVPGAVSRGRVARLPIVMKVLYLADTADEASRISTMSCNPRRADNKDGNEILPLTLAAIREHGVRSILVWCNACNHDASFNADHLPDDLPVRDVALRMHCEQCSSKNIVTFPERWVTGA